MLPINRGAGKNNEMSELKKKAPPRKKAPPTSREAIKPSAHFQRLDNEEKKAGKWRHLATTNTPKPTDVSTTPPRNHENLMEYLPRTAVSILWCRSRCSKSNA